MQEVYKAVKLLLLPGEDCFREQMLHFVMVFNNLRVQASRRACESVTVVTPSFSVRAEETQQNGGEVNQPPLSTWAVGRKFNAFSCSPFHPIILSLISHYFLKFNPYTYEWLFLMDVRRVKHYMPTCGVRPWGYKMGVWFWPSSGDNGHMQSFFCVVLGAKYVTFMFDF